MITLRKAEDRGQSRQDWLNSRHTFSFASYSDPRHMGFRALRVLNDDRVAPGKGFGAHGHRDMEILSYVLDGKLAHKDSLAGQHVLAPDEVQAMTAGTGVIHSEFNASSTQPVHFLQIWIVPAVQDLPPAYDQFAYEHSEKSGKLRLIAGPDRDVSPRAAVIHQDARIYAAVLGAGQSVEYRVAEGRHAWVQAATGDVVLNGLTLKEGDGAAVSDEQSLSLQGAGPGGGELLLFDLA